MNDTDVIELINPITVYEWGCQPESGLTYKRKRTFLPKILTAIGIATALAVCTLGLSVPMVSAQTLSYDSATVDGTPVTGELLAETLDQYNNGLFCALARE